MQLGEACGARAQPANPCRAQLSLETLVVFLIFLSILGISALAISKIGSAAKSRIGASSSKSSFNGIVSAIDEACSLGEGNVRIVELAGPASISSDGKSLSFFSGDFNSSREFRCGLSPIEALQSVSFRIENSGGKIFISGFERH